MNYFIPEIEDLHIGYEFIWNIEGSRSTKPARIDGLGVAIHYGLEVLNWREVIERGWIEVPYLTKEQIEFEGWKITHRELKEGRYKVDWINATKGIYDLWINLAMHDSMTLGINRTRQEILFKGQCKDINTFRKICKLLKIK